MKNKHSTDEMYEIVMQDHQARLDKEKQKQRTKLIKFLIFLAILGFGVYWYQSNEEKVREYKLKVKMAQIRVEEILYQLELIDSPFSIAE